MKSRKAPLQDIKSTQGRYAHIIAQDITLPLRQNLDLKEKIDTTRGKIETLSDTLLLHEEEILKLPVNNETQKEIKDLFRKIRILNIAFPLSEGIDEARRKM